LQFKKDHHRIWRTPTTASATYDPYSRCCRPDPSRRRLLTRFFEPAADQPNRARDGAIVAAEAEFGGPKKNAADGGASDNQGDRRLRDRLRPEYPPARRLLADIRAVKASIPNRLRREYQPDSSAIVRAANEIGPPQRC